MEETDPLSQLTAGGLDYLLFLLHVGRQSIEVHMDGYKGGVPSTADQDIIQAEFAKITKAKVNNCTMDKHHFKMDMHLPFTEQISNVEAKKAVTVTRNYAIDAKRKRAYDEMMEQISTVEAKKVVTVTRNYAIDAKRKRAYDEMMKDTVESLNEIKESMVKILQKLK